MLEMHIQKQFQHKDRAFRLDVRFQTSQSRMVVFGPSGAGKSLTMRAIAGLMTPDEGHIRLGDRTVLDTQRSINLSPQQRRTGYLFQDYALFPHLTVRQNIAFGLQHGWRNPRKQAQHPGVEHWLQRLGIAALADQYPASISGGQKQRVALARTLITEPDILLLDEPFAALDTTLRSSMRQILDELQQQLAIPMLLITHDPEDLSAFGDAVLHIHEGQSHD
ncbi:sulfate/molybdate ABC transporter ATP-binding protein [Leeia oryzae]|uniref:sulfate/molybdate ABC transporter ATP-binding protein n=1 Tax=Leeia oryzae TaxID=356662 RepID=UPI00036D3C9B|nr:ATP-binding cassette domain-containing protein [Leeia oryzae]